LQEEVSRSTADVVKKGDVLHDRTSRVAKALVRSKERGQKRSFLNQGTRGGGGGAAPSTAEGHSCMRKGEIRESDVEVKERDGKKIFSYGTHTRYRPKRVRRRDFVRSDDSQLRG